jgi:hypothetical protein
MFFKREQVRVQSFQEQVDGLKSKGYTTQAAAGGTLAVKGSFGALLREGAEGKVEVAEVGLLVKGELALLTDMGFQKIFHTASGHKTAALAEHLSALHAFSEDLREVLGLTSLYNQGLGTTNEKHLYDRVTLRDKAAQPKPWQKN